MSINIIYVFAVIVIRSSPTVSHKYITERNGRSSGEREGIVEFCTCQWNEWIITEQKLYINDLAMTFFYIVDVKRWINKTRKHSSPRAIHNIDQSLHNYKICRWWIRYAPNSYLWIQVCDWLLAMALLTALLPSVVRNAKCQLTRVKKCRSKTPRPTHLPRRGLRHINSKISRTHPTINLRVTVHFTRIYVHQSFFDRGRGRSGCRLELHYQRFRETNIIKKLILLCYITSTLLFYVSVFRNQNSVYSTPAPLALHPSDAISPDANNSCVGGWRPC